MKLLQFPGALEERQPIHWSSTPCENAEELMNDRDSRVVPRYTPLAMEHEHHETVERTLLVEQRRT
jgi:hypothetical protein